GLTANDNCDGAVPVHCSAGPITGEPCARSQVFTYWAEDTCHNGRTNTVTYTWKVDTTPPVISNLPDGGDLGCNNPPSCSTDVTANDNCDGTLEVQCTPGPITVTNCLRSQTFTYSATDGCKNTTNVTVTYTWTVDQTPPTLKCPPDFYCVASGGGICPTNVGGRATATDNCGGTPIITYTDVTNGTCPQVIYRTWKATDACGNKSDTCVQKITLCCTPSIITDTMRCTLPAWCGTGDGFRLIFTQDPQNIPCYKLTASNPGQFYYNIFFTGTPGGVSNVSVMIPYPFVTQGNNPIEVYDGVTSSTTDGETCLIPGNKTYAGSQKVFLTNYTTEAIGSFTTLSLQIPIPASGFVFLAIHLDYGLKGSTGYGKSASGDHATLCGSSTVVIPNPSTYTFGVAGPVTDTQSAKSCNTFKKNPGAGGSAKSSLTETQVSGARATLSDSKGALIVSGVTDEDGWYMLNYKHTGKAANFTVTLTPPGGRAKTQTVTLKANGFAEANFTIP